MHGKHELALAYAAMDWDRVFRLGTALLLDLQKRMRADPGSHAVWANQHALIMQALMRIPDDAPVPVVAAAAAAAADGPPSPPSPTKVVRPKPLRMGQAALLDTENIVTQAVDALPVRDDRVELAGVTCTSPDNQVTHHQSLATSTGNQSFWRSITC